MRILLVCESFTGGCERHIIDILNAASREGYETVLAYSDVREPGCGKDIPKLENLTTLRLRMLRRPAPLGDLIAAVRLFFLIRRGRFDIIHCHSSKAGFLGRISAAVARGLGAAGTVLYTPHGLSFQVGGLRGWFYLTAEKLVSGLTDRFVAVSEGEARLIVQHNLASGKGVTVTANGVDRAACDIRAPAEETPAVGMMGRLTEQKGALYFVDAAILAAERCPGIRFLIAGDGPQRSRLEERAQAARCKIDFPGWSDPAGFLSHTDIVVIPSLWEGLPYVLLQAMAAGRAIVASDIPGISDTLADCGLLVPPRDADALAEAICRLAEQPKERAQLAEAARKRAASHFTLQRFSTQIVRLYRTCLFP